MGAEGGRKGVRWGLRGEEGGQVGAEGVGMCKSTGKSQTV